MGNAGISKPLPDTFGDPSGACCIRNWKDNSKLFYPYLDAVSNETLKNRHNPARIGELVIRQHVSYFAFLSEFVYSL